MHRFDGNLVAVVEHIRIRILIYLIAANMPYRIHLIYAAFNQIISSNVMECSIKPSVMDTCLVEQVHIRELEEEEVKLLKNLSHLNIVCWLCIFGGCLTCYCTRECNETCNIIKRGNMYKGSTEAVKRALQSWIRFMLRIQVVSRMMQKLHL
ncbi:hypothetical protein L1987_52558 [Smallanthus sonchifolius]|uniref:Uncharacterized protein n=1 Tax=Smallanthus sonchifolius TaxID=185202 RepID=A0ACB9ETK9_9ASTR|nr:hypothetical protein L1987_52558 [Smallanthus sonchifolius]